MLPEDELYVSVTFCKPELDLGLDFQKNWTLIYITLVKNKTLYFFWMQNRPNI